MRSQNRRAAMFVVAAAILGACSSSGDSSVSTDAATASTSRERNTLVSFGADGSGVARNFITPLTMTIVANTTDQLQLDGSTLLGVVQFSVDSTGDKFTIILQRLTQATGAVDPTFGVNGKVEIQLADISETSFTITQNGHVYVTAAVEDSDGNQNGRVLRRFIAATGALDTTFGNGGEVVLIPNLGDASGQFVSVVSVNEDSNGKILILNSVEDDASNALEYRLTRIKPDGTPDIFGDVDGSITFNFQDSVEAGISRWQRDCKVIISADNNVDVLCVVDDFDVSSDSGNRILVRRGLQRLSFETDGTRRFTSAESRTNEILWIDAKDSTSIQDYFKIADIDALKGDKLSVVLEDKTGKIVAHVILTREMTNTNVDENGENIFFPQIVDDGSETGNVQFLRQPRFISSTTPAIAGMYVDAEQDEQGVVVASFKSSAFISRVALGKYPLVFHRPNPIHLDTTGQPNFSLDGLGFDLFSRENLKFDTVKNKSGFMALNTNGEARPAYANGTSFVKSPIVGERNIPAGEPSFPFEGALVAGNNDDFYALGGMWGDVSALAIKRFDGDGKQIGDVVVTSDLNFNPIIPMTSATSVIDAKNNLYIYGFASMPGARPGSEILGPGVAKFSLETGAVDTSYGENGFAFLQRIDTTLAENVFEEEWRNISLVLQADGNIDMINLSLMATKDDPDFDDVVYRSRRVSPKGSVGTERQFVIAQVNSGFRLPNNLVSALYGATIDAKGQLYVAVRDSTIETVPNEDDPTSPTTNAVPFMKVTRYNTDGTVDTAFGDDGVGGFKFDDVMFGMPIGFTQVRVQADGRILVGFTGIGMTFTDELELLGEEHYLVRLTATGNLDEFTPPEIAPDAKAARDALPTIGVEQAPSVSSQVPEAIATSGNAQLAASYEGTQVTKSGRLAITTLGVSTDRAVVVKWSIPESLSTRKLKYSVTASPGGRTCSTATTTCVFKNMNPWTAYTFTVKVVSVSAVGALSSAKSAPVKPLRVVLRGSSTPTAKLITPASKGVQSWKVGGGCTLSKDKKTFTATQDGGICTLSLTTARSGKTPKSTRSISVFVKVVAP